MSIGRILLLAAAALHSACIQDFSNCYNDYVCNDKAAAGPNQCVWAGEYGRFCARPATECESGWRYFRYVSGPLSDKCVAPASIPDAAMPADADAGKD